jgi:hypothetical protein
MKRRKRFVLKRLALAIAVAGFAAPVAQAGPVDLNGSDLRAIHSTSASAADVNTSPDDRAYSRSTVASNVVEKARVEIPYLSHGVGFSERDLGLATSPDDRSFARNTPAPSVVADDGSSFDIGSGTMSAIVLLLVAGSGAAVVMRQARRHRPAPAI